jgi:diacylglycerol kinase family enzyme
MQAHIIYNKQAGGNNGPSVEDLQKALVEIGMETDYTVTESEEDVERVLAQMNGLVVAAGGDGTVAAVLTRLIGKDTPMTFLPMGTANNIAKSLDVPTDPFEYIAGLKNPRTVPFDVGCLQAPWGEEYFVEGAGFGFYADVLAAYQPEKGKSVWRGLEALSYQMFKGNAYHKRLILNDEEIRGNYLLVEVLNTTAIGPRLKLAPKATSDDGLLELVCVMADDRAGLLDYLTSMLTEDLERMETVITRQIEALSFQWDGFPLHVDGEVRPPNWADRQEVEETEFGLRPYLPHPETGEIKVKVLPGAVSMLLPAAVE